jgi:hypothetical protein
LVSKFAVASDYEYVREGNVTVSGLRRSDVGKREILTVWEEFTHTFDLHATKITYKNTDECGEQTSMEVNDCLHYAIDTRGGMCGSLVTISGDSFSAKFLGIHVAGN